ncbi:MAG TPA: ThuA domain-containing protein [Naasia sp.]
MDDERALPGQEHDVKQEEARPAAAPRRALVVRGGWDGHAPVEATELFIPHLEASGFTVERADSPRPYADAALMASIDLIVQCVTMSTITEDEFRGLEAAVRGGAGLAGWHGGIADSYRATSDYLHLVGGQFATHPAKADPTPGETGASRNYVRHTIEMLPSAAEHPITTGIGDFQLETEQYWVLADDYNDVLATTTHPAGPGTPWTRPVTCPAIWTRSWGRGRVFVATPGHDLQTLSHPSVRTIIERGLLWAAR